MLCNNIMDYNIIVCFIIIILLLFIFHRCTRKRIVEKFCSKCGHSRSCKKCKKVFKTVTRQTLYETLEYLDEQFRQNKIKYWLMMGTLLGGVREGDIIEWDYDIDIGCMIDDLPKILSLSDDKISFVVNKNRKVYNIHDDSTKEDEWGVSVIIMCDNIPVGDIFLFQTFNDGIMRRYNIKNDHYHTPRLSFPRWFIDKLQTVKIRGKDYPTFRYPEIILQHWYGSDWKTPIKTAVTSKKSRKNYNRFGAYLQSKITDLIDYIIKNHESYVVYIRRYQNQPVYSIDETKSTSSKGQISWMKKYDNFTIEWDDLPSVFKEEDNEEDKE